MFEHLTRAHSEIPAVTWVEEADFTDVDLKRLVPLVIHAVTESLQEYPELNARVDNRELLLLDRYDVGVAVQTEQGLVVPVVHGADKLEVDELDGREIATLLNISIGTVRSRLRYARKLFRREVRRRALANAFPKAGGG